MGKIAFVFPGQGAQFVGMGHDLLGEPRASAIFAMADEAVGCSLQQMMFAGPADALKQTQYTQPALVATSYAYWAVFHAHVPHIEPHYVAGHSVGEWTAVAVAQALPIEEVLRLVHLRGRCMASTAHEGAMAAVLGASRDTVSTLCGDISKTHGTIELANFNEPRQIVISGDKQAIQAAVAQAKDYGIRRIIPLEVSGAFHSSFMRDAAQAFSVAVDAVQFIDARYAVMTNVDAQAHRKADAFPPALVRQLYSPVRWEESIRTLIAQGVDTFIEFGPGTVLTNLIKKIDSTVHTYNVNGKQAIETTIEAWRTRQHEEEQTR